ncbi:MAG TPA: hypothetical protein VN757_10330 [Steroidobacteraceae bacterium]|nr:hypothetical protein [Steroidobacteraceae bacterium]
MQHFDWETVRRIEQGAVDRTDTIADVQYRHGFPDTARFALPRRSDPSAHVAVAVALGASVVAAFAGRCAQLPEADDPLGADDHLPDRNQHDPEHDEGGH